jgi:hypothetical protein
LIFTRKWTYNEGYNYVLTRRGVVNPNMTFIAQLICFHKRLFEESFESIPVSPRVYVIGSHQIEDPDSVVPRMLMENLY